MECRHRAPLDTQPPYLSPAGGQAHPCCHNHTEGRGGSRYSSQQVSKEKEVTKMVGLYRERQPGLQKFRVGGRACPPIPCNN